MITDSVVRRASATENADSAESAGGRETLGVGAVVECDRLADPSLCAGALAFDADVVLALLGRAVRPAPCL